MLIKILSKLKKFFMQVLKIISTIFFYNFVYIENLWNYQNTQKEWTSYYKNILHKTKNWFMFIKHL